MIIGAFGRRSKAPCRTRIRWPSIGRRSNRLVDRIFFLCSSHDFPPTLHTRKRRSSENRGLDYTAFARIDLHIFPYIGGRFRTHTQAPTSRSFQTMRRLQLLLHYIDFDTPHMSYGSCRSSMITFQRDSQLGPYSTSPTIISSPISSHLA